MEATSEEQDEPRGVEELPRVSSKGFIKDLAAYRKRYTRFHTQAKANWAQYSLQEGDSDRATPSYPIYWSTIETQKSALFNDTPTPTVDRYVLERDGVARAASEVLEKALSAESKRTFREAFDACVLDYLISGRGSIWVIPDIEFEEQTVVGARGEPELIEAPVEYRVLFDYVDVGSFALDPQATKWANCQWVARKVVIPIKEARQAYLETGKLSQSEFDAAAEQRKGGEEDRVEFASEAKGAQSFCYWEVWHKGKRCVAHVSEYVDTCLEYLDGDSLPMDLEGFFPCPRPLLGTCGKDSLIPTSDFRYWEKHAKQVTKITRRISTLA